MGDNITKPDHYCEGREYEPKDVIRDWGLNFNLGSAVKYISRAGRKGDKLEDLQKAKQFLEFEIEAVEEASREEDEKRISAELLSRAVTENSMRFEDVPESLKPRVINNIAQEVLDNQCDIENDISSDELREDVIKHIIEKLESGENNTFDIPFCLFDYSPAIREWVNNKIDKGWKYEKMQQELDGAIAKELFKEEKTVEESYDHSLADLVNEIMSRGDIPEPEVINLAFKFHDMPEGESEIKNTVTIKFNTYREED